ncbi:hypothetical protein WICPIJ_005078 [Wickerhamomyces pijperi]|uniref:Uncharacterized protein n=1 Tax=Wickerhamomyces pijperi TaxID=599730 RepID=A0A9P8TMA7_WICPI|nr:hypothetical protein WICPIJ_005078 [Wickerhamomyces pijperi]
MEFLKDLIWTSLIEAETEGESGSSGTSETGDDITAGGCGETTRLADAEGVEEDDEAVLLDFPDLAARANLSCNVNLFLTTAGLATDTGSCSSVVGDWIGSGIGSGVALVVIIVSGLVSCSCSIGSASCGSDSVTAGDCSMIPSLGASIVSTEVSCLVSMSCSSSTASVFACSGSFSSI